MNGDPDCMRKDHDEMFPPPPELGKKSGLADAMMLWIALVFGFVIGIWAFNQTPPTPNIPDSPNAVPATG